jgi:3-hydroxybutyryl-CoA dehydrogenase
MKKMGVVGCGLMGTGIAEVGARAGLDVVVIESSPAAVEAGHTRLEQSLSRAAEKGKIVDAAEVLARISVSTELEKLADRELVVEAIVEDETSKVELFAKLDTIVTSTHALLASNTSSIPIMKLAVATSRPTHVLGVHFFNPVPVLSLVELVPSLLTAPEVTATARTFVEQTLGKHAIDCQDPRRVCRQFSTDPLHPLGDPDG